MTKAQVSSVLGILVEEGVLDWKTPIHEVLAEYQLADAMLSKTANLIDWLSMRSGTESYQPWFQSHNNVMFTKSDAMKVINNLYPAAGLRSRFQYSNWGYELADQVMQILEPLGLDRTDARGTADFENIAQAYTVLDDGTANRIRQRPFSGASIMNAAGGVRSCVNDLLHLYHAILRASIDQFANDRTWRPELPFKQLTTTMSAHTILPGPSLRESTYGMGWLRTELPNIMCKISPNYDQLGEEPILGEGAPSKLLIAHYGSMPGAYCGVNLFPETESVIVVLTNSTPMCDMSDWIIQLLTQTLFDFSQKNDYVKWTKKTVERELGWHDRLMAELERMKIPGTKPRNLEDYVGEYRNEADTFTITVKLQEDQLSMSLQARDDETFALNSLRTGLLLLAGVTQ